MNKDLSKPTEADIDTFLDSVADDYKYDTPQHVFDGYCYRPFDEDRDGWISSQYRPNDFAVVKQAEDVLAMFRELNRLARENWELKRELKRNKMEFWSNATPGD